MKKGGDGRKKKKLISGGKNEWREEEVEQTPKVSKNRDNGEVKKKRMMTKDIESKEVKNTYM